MVQQPVEIYPIKSFSKTLTVLETEQLKTIHNLANILARSLHDSVFPLPGGPAGLAPSFILNAVFIVSQHLSVKGVTTSLLKAPTINNYIK